MSDAEPGTPAAVSRRGLCLLFVGLVGLFGLTAHGYLENSDADVAMHSARAIWLRGNPGLLRAGPDTWEAERYIAEQVHAAPDNGFGVVGSEGRAYTFGSIGYQLFNVPFVVLGDLCTELWPEPEAQLRATRPPLFNELFWTRFWLSFVSPVAAAGSVIVLLLLGRALGAMPRQAVLVAGVAAACTQFWPGARETTPDGLGMFFLLAAVLRAVEYAKGLRPGGALLTSGACAGAAVLVRYPHAVPVAILGVWLVVAAWRRGRLRDAALFPLAGLPIALLLGLLNLWCFDSMTATGYANPGVAAWWSYPVHIGASMMLVAPGKGVLWFSLPLWLAVGACVRLRMHDAVLWLAVLQFVACLALYGHTHGWAAGQCWGIRYITPTAVLLIVVGLNLDKPWLRMPRRFWAVVGLGALVSLGGILTSYRGQQFVALAAAEKVYEAELAAGEFPIEYLSDRVNVHPRFSPIHTHWIYAWHSLRGELGPGGAERNTLPVFGVVGPLARPIEWYPREELAARHFWMVYLDDLVGFPLLVVSVSWLGVTSVLLGLGLWRWSRSSPAPAAAE